MDFGLAKLISGADVTKTLTVMGTIAYQELLRAAESSAEYLS